MPYVQYHTFQNNYKRIIIIIEKPQTCPLAIVEEQQSAKNMVINRKLKDIRVHEYSIAFYYHEKASAFHQILIIVVVTTLQYLATFQLQHSNAFQSQPNLLVRTA